MGVGGFFFFGGNVFSFLNRHAISVHKNRHKKREIFFFLLSFSNKLLRLFSTLLSSPYDLRC